MKLIALRDFAKVGPLKDLQIETPTHPGQIDKGTIFEIGKAKTLPELVKANAAEGQLVATLVLAKSVGDGNDAEVVKAVREEIAIEKKRQETAAKLNEAAQTSHLSEALLAMLKKAAAAPAK